LDYPDIIAWMPGFVNLCRLGSKAVARGGKNAQKAGFIGVRRAFSVTI
jgi:hypothetical protein